MKKYRLLVTLTDLEVNEVLIPSVATDSVVLLNPESEDVKNCVLAQLIEEVSDDTDLTVLPEQESKPEVKLFRGQVVITDSSRVVNEKEYHHIRIADGSTYDLSDEEYETNVTVQK